MVVCSSFQFIQFITWSENCYVQMRRSHQRTKTKFEVYLPSLEKCRDFIEVARIQQVRDETQSLKHVPQPGSTRSHLTAVDEFINCMLNPELNKAIVRRIDARNRLETVLHPASQVDILTFSAMQNVKLSENSRCLPLRSSLIG